MQNIPNKVLKGRLQIKKDTEERLKKQMIRAKKIKMGYDMSPLSDEYVYGRVRGHEMPKPTNMMQDTSF